MTIGSVTATRKPLLPITLMDSVGNRHTLRVILDTGFTGELLLAGTVYPPARPDAERKERGPAGHRRVRL